MREKYSTRSKIYNDSESMYLAFTIHLFHLPGRQKLQNMSDEKQILKFKIHAWSNQVNTLYC